MVICIIG